MQQAICRLPANVPKPAPLQLGGPDIQRKTLPSFQNEQSNPVEPFTNALRRDGTNDVHDIDLGAKHNDKNNVNTTGSISDSNNNEIKRREIGNDAEPGEDDTDNNSNM